MGHFLEKLDKQWAGWEVRLLILSSLTLQIILIILGDRRKVTASMMVSFLVWSAYLLADAVASISLGNLARLQINNQDKSKVLQAFWAPFLLLHLGGPDTITAYSLEDNELWSRHLLGLLVHIVLAIYVSFRSWTIDNALAFIAIPVYIAGIIKYGERTFVLWSSCIGHFRDFLQSSPAPAHAKERIDPGANYRVQASVLFKRSAYLFANLILDFHGKNDTGYSLISGKSAAEAFQLVEAELGFMYDVLFTKATVVYSRRGIFLRCISFFSSVSVLIVFSIIIDINAYPIADISVTYSLLVAAVFLEIYAFILFLLSDQTKIWSMKPDTAEHYPIPRRLYDLSSRVVCCSEQRWSRSMAQYNLIKSCLKDESTAFIGVRICKLADLKWLWLSWESVDESLKDMIFQQIQRNSDEVLNNPVEYETQQWKQIMVRRGDYVLENKYFLHGFRWSTIEVDFDYSLLVWHIATDLCCYKDIEHFRDKKPECLSQKEKERKPEGKLLSDYMLYLLVFCPSMLHVGISHEIRYKDTYNAMKRILEPKIKDEGSACEELLQRAEHNQMVDNNNMSVLHLGCKLAKNLQQLESSDPEFSWTSEKKWEMISEVWTEMLVHAACHCGWQEHQQQLGKGGELLTHVSLVMAHLGLSKQYRMKDDVVIPDREWSSLL